MELRITRQIHCKAVEQRATLIHRQYNRYWGTSYSRPPIDPYLTSPLLQNPGGATDARCRCRRASCRHCDMQWDDGTGVNPAGDAGDTSPNILVGGTSMGISPQYYYVLSDIADQYWLPSVRSASSRFHSAIRRHQFASVRQADSRLTRLVPPTLNSR